MFIDKRHEARFYELLQLDHTHAKDYERKALFYILTGQEGLSNKVHHLYDFKEQMIKPECLEDLVDLTSSERTLVKLGYNLYNSFPSDSIIDTFYTLDKPSFGLALKAIYLRFYGAYNLDLDQGLVSMLEFVKHIG